MRSPHPWRAGLMTAVCFLLPVTGLHAQDVGLRAGVSAGPDQFYFGVHVRSDPLIDRLRFRPNLEIGVGDDLTVVTGNLEFAYEIPLRRQPWDVYLGGGPALVIANHRGRRGGTDTGGGFNILVGLEHQGGLFVEFKVGAIDSPDVKFGIGYTWR